VFVMESSGLDRMFYSNTKGNIRNFCVIQVFSDIVPFLNISCVGQWNLSSSALNEGAQFRLRIRFDSIQLFSDLYGVHTLTSSFPLLNNHNVAHCSQSSCWKLGLFRSLGRNSMSISQVLGYCFVLAMFVSSNSLF
jgi:hypothetical protein